MDGGLAGIGAEQRRQPVDGAVVVFTLSTHVTNPGRETGHGHQFLIQPGEIGNVVQAHHTRLALVARKHRQFIPFGRFAVHTAAPCTASCKMDTPWLVPSRLAPALIMACASFNERMPPAALTPIPVPTTRRINATSSTVAPPTCTA